LAVAFVAGGWAASLEAGEAAFKVADVCTVKTPNAPIRQGQKVLGWLAQGQRVKLYLVQGGFGYVRVPTADGTLLEGYVSLRDLEPPVREAKAAEPAPFSVGDEVIVVARQAELKKGTTVIAVLPVNTRLVVRKVQDKWLGVYADVEGKQVWGFIDHKCVDYAPISGKEPPKEDAPPPKKPDESKAEK
jgi:hypothetical protein